MPVLILCIAGGIAFLLVFLRACLRETKRKGPHYVLVLQPPSPAEAGRSRAAVAGEGGRGKHA